jgi:hypothetical protein
MWVGISVEPDLQKVAVHGVSDAIWRAEDNEDENYVYTIAT